MVYKILIVDDEEAVRDLFSELLKKEGYKTNTCATGEETLELLKKENFDVVLLDIKLPGVSGLEVLKNIRDSYSNLPVVMITGFGYDEDLISKTKQLGCSGYIGKNMPISQIITTFKQFVKSAKENGSNT
ncbi:MAG: response regulator [Candidatus Omnitrophota bacterium]